MGRPSLSDFGVVFQANAALFDLRVKTHVSNQGLAVFKAANIPDFRDEIAGQSIADSESPSMKDQVRMFEILKNNSKLLKEYEQIKFASDGLSFREYMRRKYEFFNKVLGSKP